MIVLQKIYLILTIKNKFFKIKNKKLKKQIMKYLNKTHLKTKKIL